MLTNRLILILSVLFFLGESTAIIGQQYTFEWARGPHNDSFESGNSVVVDSVNHFVYIAGVMQETLSSYPDIQSSMMNGGTNNENKDGFVAKYDFQGNVIWAFNIGGVGDDEVTGITIGPSGNIYITGYYEGTVSLDGHTTGVSGNVFFSFGGKDIFVASYNDSGALLSYSVFGGLYNDAGIDICANSSSIFVTGFYTNNAIFGSNNTSVSYNNVNIFIIAMDFNNNLLWLIDAGSDGNDFDTTLTYQERNMSITADDTAIYVTGLMKGNNFLVYNSDGSFADTLYNEDTAENIFILSYHITGMYNWGQVIENKTDPVNGMGIAVNPYGVYITATVHNLAKFPSGTVFSSSNSDIIVSQLNKSTGIDNWINQTTGDSVDNDIGYEICADNAGGIYITGTYASDPFTFGQDTSINVYDQQEAFVAKYNSSGDFQYVINAFGYNNEKGLGISAYKDSSVFITGTYSEDIHFSNNYIQTTDNNNIFLAKLLPFPKTGFSFDQSGCTGDTDNNGFITSVDGNSVLEVMPCQHVQICETIFVADDLGNGWLDSVNFELGPGYTNISAINPNGTNNGFYQTGDWTAQYNSTDNSISWWFNNYFYPNYGDGYIYNNTYSCEQGTPHEYQFCFEADISSMATSNNDLQINMTISDDGFSTNTSISVATALMNEITINDPPPVFINCPDDTLISTTGNSCSAILSWNPPQAIDNCGADVNQISGLPSGSTFPLGITEISYVATDSIGNTDTCSFTITVVDNTPPVITCPANQTVNIDPDSCSYTASGNEFDPISYADNCSPVSISNNLNGDTTLSDAIFLQETTTIIWEVIDSSGNTNTCNFTVTVIDSTPPEITCPSNQVFSTNTGICSFTPAGGELDPLSISDNCSIASVTNNINSSGTLDNENFDLGDTTIIWTVTDSAGNINTCSFILTVVDSVPPEIICDGNQTVGTSPLSCDYTVLGNLFSPVLSSDNCSVTVSVSNNINGASNLNGVILPIGQNIIWWIATDNSGNSDSCSMIITVVDSTPPQISCIGDQTRPIAANCEYSTQGNEFDPISANDNCSNFTLSNNINGNNTLSGENFSAGTHPVIWYAEDSNGNIDSCSFILTIIDTIPPTITCQTNQVIYLDSLHCSYLVQGTELDPLAVNDNCSSFNLHNNFNGSNTLAGQDLPISQNEILWIVTDDFGNTDSCTTTVTVVDTIRPDFDWPQDIVTCDSIVFWQPPDAYDNCSAVTVVQTGNTQFSSGSVFPVGTTTIEYTATDSSNNSQTTQFNITVLTPLHPYWSGLPAQICLYDNPLLLNNLITGDTGGIWLVDGNIQSGFNPVLEGSGIHNITYQLNNGYCTADSSLSIEVINAPDVNAGENQDVCGLSYQLEGNISDGNAYWSTQLSNVLFSPDTISLNPIVTVPDFGNYYFNLIASDNNCVNQDSVIISFYEAPQVVDAGSDQILNIINETQLNALSPAIGTGEWSFLQGSGNISTTNDPASFVSNLAENENILIWTVINGPCRDSDLVTITVHGLKISDAFSPNGDGFNDFFVITGIEEFQSELTVFNRWGKEICHYTNYQNNWNGKTQDGKDLPEDTYFYILTIDGKNYNGSITLSR